MRDRQTVVAPFTVRSIYAMATNGGGPSPNVTDLLQKLNLTAEEEQVIDFSDEEDYGDEAVAEWCLIGKVLASAPLHANTIRAAMRPAWGNPFGLKIRSIGDKADNLFIAEFGCMIDRDRALSVSPWIVGKYAVLLQKYDEKLSAAEIQFDKFDIWARLINLPLGWMNQERGSKAMGLLGEVVSMDVDQEGKASGAYLRGRITLDLSKPVKRGILMRLRRNEEPWWFAAQYEKIPFFYFSCGIIGHSDLQCPTPVSRDGSWKLPYQTEPPLRAPDDRRKKV